MLPILALRHVRCEGPGLLDELARRRGMAIEIADLPDRFPAWPEPAQYGGMVILGGPMSVYDTQRFGWLRDEVRLVRRCMEEGLPILGICLGAQILAAACEARVYPGSRKEIGWGPIQLRRGAEIDPLFETVEGPLTVFHWHGDTFDLPDRSQILASSALYQNQAFRVEDRFYGFQFHLEVTEGMPEAWAAEYAAELGQTGGPTVGGSLDRSNERIAALRPSAERILGRWLERAGDLA